MPLTKLEEGKYLQTIDDFRGGLVTNVDPAKMGEDNFSILENTDLHHDYEGSLLGRKAYIPVGYNSTTPASSTKLNLTGIASLFWKKFKKVLTTDPVYYFYIFYNSKYIKVYEESILTAAITTLKLPFNFLKTNALNFYNNLYVVGTQVKTETTLVKNTNPNFVIVRDTVEEQGCPPCPQTFKVIDSGFPIGTMYDDETREYLITFLYDNNQESYVIPFNQNAGYNLKDIDYQSNILATGKVTASNLILPAFALRKKSVIVSTTFANLLSEIPIGNSRVVARKIYIKKATGNYLHLIGTLDNNTDTTFLDTYLQASVIAPAEINFVYRPPNAKLISSHKESLLLANTFDRQYMKESEITTIEFDDVAAPEDEASEIGSCSVDLITGDTVDAVGTYYRYIFYDLFPILNSIMGYLGGFISEFKDYIGNLPYEAYADQRNVAITTDRHVKISYKNYNKWSGKCAVFRNCSAFIRQSTGDGTNAKFYYGNCTFKSSKYVWSDCPILFKINDKVELDTTGNGDFGFGVQYTVIETGKDKSTILGVDTFAKNVPWFKVAYTDGINPATVGDIVISTKLFYQGTTKINTGAWEDTQTYYDKTSDLMLMEVHGAFQAKYLCNLVNEERPYMLMSSEVGEGDIFDPANERPVGHTDNTGISAIASEENAIIIWKEDSLWKINTNSVSKDYWTLTRLSSSHGLANDKALAIVNDSAYIFWYQGRCYHWFSTTSIPVYCSAQINSLLPAGFVIENSYYDSRNDRVLFFISYVVSTVTYNKILIYDLKFRTEKGIGKWYIHYGTVAYEDLSAYNLPLTAGFVGPQKEDYFVGAKEFYKYDEYTRASDLLIDNGGNYASAPFCTKFQTKEFDTTKYEVKEISMKIINTGNASRTNIKMLPVVDGTNGTEVPLSALTITGNNRVSGGINIQSKNTISLVVTIRNFIKPIVRELSMIMNLIHNTDARKR